MVPTAGPGRLDPAIAGILGSPREGLDTFLQLYLRDFVWTQQGRLPRLAAPRRVPAGSVMEIDAATRRNLELTQALSGGRKGSLLATIDRTVFAITSSVARSPSDAAVTIRSSPFHIRHTAPCSSC